MKTAFAAHNIKTENDSNPLMELSLSLQSQFVIFLLPTVRISEQDPPGYLRFLLSTVTF